MKRIFITFLGMAVVAGLIAPGVSNAQSPAATGGTRSNQTVSVPDTTSSTNSNTSSNSNTAASSNPVPAQPGNAPEVSPSRRPCIAIEQNLGYGAKDRTTNGSVMNYQVFLKLHGYLFVEPTGFFGPLTLAATKAFQKAFGIPTTGFAGPLTRAQMKATSCADDMPTPAEGISYVVKTNKEVYAPGEDVVITITATNNSNVARTLNFTSCQSSYKIGDYDFKTVMLCIKALTNVTIPAKGVKTWTHTHSDDLAPGRYTVTGEVIGYASPFKTITVTGTTTPNNSVTVVSPNGGETLKRGTVTKINWIGSESVDIKLKAHIVCITTPCEGAKYTIKNKVNGTTFDWTVGTIVEKIALSDGNYQIEVCKTGTTTCDTSDAAFMMSNATVTAPTITSISPTSGKIGSKITINGTGFSSTSAIRFGGGYIPKDSVTVANGRLEFTLPEAMGICSPYHTGACALIAYSANPGVHKVSVENTDGTKSAEVLFTVRR